ncbi:MAG: glycoside hydrolase family 9 protein [Proteobacteria bacterium]|nr:glycoside hydrolase family 9 protein [Pseudomonadota bacterium]
MGIAGPAWPAVAAGQSTAPQRPLVLVDQVGYDTAAPKRAVVQGSVADRFTAFKVIDVANGKVVLQGTPQAAGTVDHWNDWHYWTIDFSALKTPGRYRVDVSGNVAAFSFPFRIAHDVLQRYTLSNVIYYFKGQRVTGDFDRADAHLKNPDPKGLAYVDLGGGWLAATGDYGVHLAEGNHQEVSLVAWSLIQTWRNLAAAHDQNFAQYERRLLDEATYGADFLVRAHVAGGSFYQSIGAPGRAKAAADRLIEPTNFRQVIKTTPGSAGSAEVGQAEWPKDYVAGFGTGGGMAIAALAAASTLPEHGEFTSQRYRATAEDAFRYLQRHNRELTRDGSQDIVDDFCALLAATELYRASHDEAYRKAADAWADGLMARLATHDGHRDYWRAGEGPAPFFNATDDGMPVVALAGYAAIASPAQRAKARDAIRRSMEFQLRITGDVNNPFDYARELVRLKDGSMAVKFFFPHGAEGTWWQGEDARLASLAAAARAAAPLFADDTAFQSKLQDYAWSQLHWILGRNPYDTSMLIGSGHRHIQYMFFDSWEYTNAPGAIINGITSGLDAEDDGIAFDLGYAQTGKDDDWRWGEQWLPHAAWYLYAISLPRD